MMNWIYSESRFKYNGKPVVRKKAICYTPVGEFRVYESVGGKVFYSHPYLLKNTSGLAGYDPDPHNEFATTPRMPCKSLKEGIARCESKWQQIKNAINQI